MTISGLFSPANATGLNVNQPSSGLKSTNESKDIFEEIREKGGLREYARQIQEDKIKEELEKRILEEHGLSEEEFTELEKENPALYQQIEAQLANDFELIIQGLLEKIAGAAKSGKIETIDPLASNQPLEGGLNKNGTGQIINVLV